MLKRSISRQRGFSMIEIAVTLTMIALLAAAALPSVGEWIRNVRVRNTAESLQLGLQQARTEALRRNQNVTFWLVAGSDNRLVDNSCALSSASGSWVIALSDPTGLCASAPHPTTAPMIVATQAAGDGGVTVAARSAASTAASCVRFSGLGQLAGSSSLPADDCRTPDQIATVDVTHSSSGARRLRIVVSAAGSVRMCDRDVASSDPRACPA